MKPIEPKRMARPEKNRLAEKHKKRIASRAPFFTAVLICAAITAGNAVTKKPFRAEALFSLPEEHIAYFKSEQINTEDYAFAARLRNDLKANNARVYSILIADILSSKGNEFIVVKNDGAQAFVIYRNDGSVYKEFRMASSAPHTQKAAVELKEYEDADGSFAALYFYSMTEHERTKLRAIDLEIFLLREDETAFVADVKFYREAKGNAGAIVNYLEHTFANVTDSGVLDLLIAEHEIINGNDHIFYHLYVYDKKTRRYEFTMGDFEFEGDAIDYGAYFAFDGAHRLNIN